MSLLSSWYTKISQQLMIIFAFCYNKVRRPSLAQPSVDSMQDRLLKAGQEHLTRFWSELTIFEQQRLINDIQSLNLNELNEYFTRATTTLNAKVVDPMEPLPRSKIMSVDRTPEDVLRAYRNEGLRQISYGRVGVLLLAGGQGTRLGFDHPKGMYDVGLPSHKTLFRLLAERISTLQLLANAATGRTGIITWYIMVSEHTVLPTHAYFSANNYFQLGDKNVLFFQQASLPCFASNGKILLDQKHRVTSAPDGNGGIFRALHTYNVLKHMRERGVLYLHAHGVDNILTKVADPTFIGFCVMDKADCAAKVVKKIDPSEPLGVIAIVNKKIRVVEYSEITPATAEMRNSNGDLSYSAGSICNHFFTLEFLENVCTKYEVHMKLHIARKKVPYVDAYGERILPLQPNAIKIEKFVFDVFEYAENFLAMEVRREVEFSALKNNDAAGIDCPWTAREDVFRLHKSYIEAAGGIVLGDQCEISPLLSYEGENIEKLVSGKTFTSPVHLRGPRDLMEK